MLKADLWTHLTDSIKGQSQEIKRLADTSEEQNCEIVDIQFAMSDYQYLEDIVAIKDYANQIATYDAELKSLEEDAEEVSTVSKLAKFMGE